MGDMAEAILNGDFDEQTGEWLGEGMGYPRSLRDKVRFKKNDDTGIKTLNAAIGVSHYLRPYSRKVKREIVKLYCEKLNINYEQVGFDKACEEIQKNFPKFCTFVNTNINQFKNK